MEMSSQRATFLISLKRVGSHGFESMHLTRDVHLVIDNHVVHHSKKVQHEYQGMKVLFTPTYSPFLNPAETIFALAKPMLRNHFARYKGELTQEGFEAEVDFVLDTEVKPRYDGRRLCNSARGEYEKVLCAEEAKSIEKEESAELVS